MKRTFITIISIGFITVLPLFNVYANESPLSLNDINSFKEDITGDGQKEQLNLKGSYLSNDSNYLQQTTLEITNTFNKEWNLSLKGGYDPKLHFYDLNHDKVVDLLYEVAIDDKKEQHSTQAYTLKNKKVEQINLPKHNPTKGIYRDNFRIELLFVPSKEKTYLPIVNQDDLIDDKIYNKQGEVLKDSYIYLEPIERFIPILISERKGYGLKSIQKMLHPSNQKLIGTLETLWYFNKEKDKWIILKTQWKHN